MPSGTIYAKTQKGFEEMTRRTYRLPARMRSLLIMIDGHLPAGELFARAPHPEEAQQLIESLLKDGFIEPVGGIDDAGELSNAASAPLDTAASAPSPDLALVAAKRYVAQAMLDALGPEADHFTVHIEAASDAGSLKAIALEYLDVIRGASDRRKADAFRDGLVQLHLLGQSEGLPPDPPEAAVDLRNAKRVMVQRLVAALGPDADRFTLAAERAANAEEFRALLAKYQEVVRAMAGHRKADEFVAAVSAALAP
ncbi:MAG TPA: hypothetical protein VIS73_02910 [Rhodocyclaceae bacterium]